jgi:hypothetical protein
MRQAFEGYINYIGDDEEVQKAWAYATLVGLEELLLIAWKGVRRDLLHSMETTDAVLSLEGAEDLDDDTESATGMEASVSLPDDATSGDPTPQPATCVTKVASMAREDVPDSGPGPVKKKPKTRTTSTSSDIRVHFAAVPPEVCLKTKRTRDVQVRVLGQPSRKKLKALAAIPEFIRHCPRRQGTKRKRTPPLLTGEAPASVEEVDLTTAMHVLSDTVMPPLYVNVPNTCSPTRAPLPGPSLTLVTVNVHVPGSTGAMEPTQFLPDLFVHTQLPVGLAVPVFSVNVVSLSSLPSGSTTISKPLNER